MSRSQLKSSLHEILERPIKLPPFASRLVRLLRDRRVRIAFGAALPLALFVWLRHIRHWQPLPLQVSRGGSFVAAFSPDGKTVASTEFLKKTVYLYDYESKRVVQILSGVGGGGALAFSHDGSTLAGVSHDSRVFLSNVQTGEVKTSVTSAIPEVWSLAFSPDGLLLAVGGLTRRAGKVGTHALEVWNVPRHGLVTRLQARLNDVRAVTFSPDGKLLAASGPVEKITSSGLSRDEAVAEVWDLQARKLKWALHSSGGINSIAFSLDGQVLAVADGIAKICDDRTGKILHELSCGGSIHSVAFSRQGDTLVTFTDNGDAPGCLWDTRNWTLLRKLQHGGQLFWPDDSTFAVAAPTIDANADRVMVDRVTVQLYPAK
jgi:WD40 repeat protein